MMESFLTFLNDHQLDLSAAPTLLAVSGGVDSLVMAELFRRSGFPFALAHCNFGLRGGESDADERFVRQWAEQAGVPCHVRYFDTQREADTRHISIQMAARDLRYAWFKELLHDFGYAHLALAHHAEDAIETVLLNLVRGTGLAGMLGIAPFRSPVIRPLLYTSKNEIKDFAIQQNIAWREDSSNATEHYRRNVLRHRVLPVLQELNPSLHVTFRHTVERLRAGGSLLDTQMHEWQAHAVRREGETAYISMDALRQTREPTYHLHSVLESFGYSYAQARAIVASLDATSGKRFLSTSHMLVIDRSELILRPRTDPVVFQPVLIPKSASKVSLGEGGTLVFSRYANSSDFVPNPGRHRAYFDEALLKFPLTVRPWERGDRFCPFGMKGKSKKISDLLVENKVPVSHKQDCLVLINGDQSILWVIGLRSDDRFRLRSQTAIIVQAELIA